MDRRCLVGYDAAESSLAGCRRQPTGDSAGCAVSEMGPVAVVEAPRTKGIRLGAASDEEKTWRRADVEDRDTIGGGKDAAVSLLLHGEQKIKLSHEIIVDMMAPELRRSLCATDV